MKGFSQFLTLILIFIIVVSLVSLLTLYFMGYFDTITSSFNPNVGDVISSCMKIDSVNSNKIYLRNCGSGVIKKDKLNIMIDNESFNFSMNKDNVGKDETAEISINGSWRLGLGNHKVSIFSTGGKVERYVKAVLPDSCVLDLEFDEGSGNIANDSSSNGNNGQLLPVGSLPKWVDGKSGKGLSFDGINDYVLVPFSTSIDVRDAITVELWVKLSTIHQNGDTEGYPRFMYRSQDDSNNRPIDLMFQNASKEIIFQFRKSGTTYGVQTFGSPLNANKWYHILVSYDKDAGVNNMKIYLDDLLKDSITNNMGTIPTGQGIYGDLGIFGVGDWGFINGTADEVRIYNKALTPDETVVLKLGELT